MSGGEITAAHKPVLKLFIMVSKLQLILMYIIPNISPEPLDIWMAQMAHNKNNFVMSDLHDLLIEAQFMLIITIFLFYLFIL